MRKTLIATSALAFAGAMAAAPASAADMIGIGVGGYMEQWIGYANRDDDGVDGGFDTQSDSEIYFTGSMESDMGLKFGVRVQLEANNNSDGATSIDESNAWVSGEFGRIDLGARDPIHTRMHYAAAFGAGAGLNAGDTQKWDSGLLPGDRGLDDPGRRPDLDLCHAARERRPGGHVLCAGLDQRERGDGRAREQRQCGLGRGGQLQRDGRRHGDQGLAGPRQRLEPRIRDVRP